MKVGDLVRYNDGPVFNAPVGRYAASGVITGVIGVEKQTTRPWPCYSVLWADGRTTNEWFSYLEVLT